jgi:hypothetical protein
MMDRYLPYGHEILNGNQAHSTTKLPMIYDYDVLAVLSKN